MNLIPVLNYLNHYELSELTAYSGVKVKDYGDFVVLNYDQIETKKTDPRWHDCRGLIVRKQPKGSYTNRDILSRPFTRFFNFGETFDTNEFDFARSITYDKVDGSLMPVWFNPFANRWEAGTRQMALGEGTTSFGNTFRQLFLDGGFDSKETLFQDCMNMMNSIFPGYTWIFEMTSPETRIVTPHTEKSIWFLAARNNESGQYLMAGAIKQEIQYYLPLVKFPKEYHFFNAKDCAAAASDLPAMEEGYVVYDPVTQARVKLKNPAYVAIHHIRDNGVLNPKRIMALVLENEYEEYLKYFESDKKFFTPYIIAYEKLVNDILTTYNKYKIISNQKDFALAIASFKFKGILFALRSKKGSLKKLLLNSKIDNIIEMLDL